MNKFRLTGNDCLLLVIDIQERLAAAMKPEIRDSVVRNTSILFDLCRVCNIPALVTEQYPKGLGPTLPELKEKSGSCPVLEKIHFDCMKDDAIRKSIESSGKKNIIIAGMETHICVLQTVLSLVDSGFRVVLVPDAVSSRSKFNWKNGCSVAAMAGALIYPTETVAFMILEKAGTAAFKEISPLFR